MAEQHTRAGGRRRARRLWTSAVLSAASVCLALLAAATGLLPWTLELAGRVLPGAGVDDEAEAYIGAFAWLFVGVPVGIVCLLGGIALAIAVLAGRKPGWPLGIVALAVNLSLPLGVSVSALGVWATITLAALVASAGSAAVLAICGVLWVLGVRGRRTRAVAKWSGMVLGAALLCLIPSLLAGGATLDM